jgi:ATP-dependent RNA helicase DBP3
LRLGLARQEAKQLSTASINTTMPKRTLDDAELVIGSSIVRESHPVSKKSRKEKRTIEDPRTANTDVPTSNGHLDEESKAARKEKKRLKKLKKETKATASDSESAVPNGSISAPESAAAVLNGASQDPLDTKAARKAEKARLKAMKRAEEENISGDDSEIPVVDLSSISKGPPNSSYIEASELTALPQSEIDTFLATNFISIIDPIPSAANLRPLTKFSFLPISDPAQRAPFKAFKAPTPIQAAAWPFLFAGRDVIGVAETGSGKTMAFAVPCVRSILSLPQNQRNRGARAVIVSPTRELAMQSYEQIMQLAKVSGLQAVCVYGGVPKDEQRKALKTADIVVATPGRLNDLINEGYADLSKAKYVVLDEADRMLDKGFEDEIRKIINTTPNLGKRQTLMFTATWPESVRTLAATFMTSPVKIAIGDNPSGDLRANARIEQKVEVVDPRNKEYRLLQLLKQYQSGSQKDDRILVFALYKKEATRVEGFIRSKGFRVAGIHGDLSQEQRTRSLDAFKQGNTPILVATDVAARGLDIPAVKLVINCTFPLVCFSGATCFSVIL